MGKIAFLFAGQGAQKVGMGKNLADNFACAADAFSEASEALGSDVAKMIFEGTDEELQITENTQPTILTMSVAALRVVNEYGIKPDVCAGLSLGEYTAHVASGSLKYADAVRLVKKRGKYMQEEVPQGKGAMAAVIGLDADTVRACCTAASQYGVCTGANFNCPGQVVVSGEKPAVEKCCDIAKEKGAKRALMLPVSAPFHCELLKGAGEKLEREMQNVAVYNMNVPVITNVTADYVKNSEEIKPLLVRQVSNSVLWEDSIRRMISDGIDTFVEIGPGKALSGFMKRIDGNMNMFNVEDVVSLEKTVEGLKNLNLI